jgi:hypothetical protein
MCENREARRLPVGVDDAPPGWIAGWQVGARAGREGKASGRKPEMNGRRESDSRVVPAKLANKAGRPAAELVEGRRLDEGNTGQQNALRTQGRDDRASRALERVRRVAVKDRKARFTALLHHVDVERLRAAYRALSPTAAAGVDEVTWESYGQGLEANLQDLYARVQRGAYRAKPSRRVYIAKADGRLRPLGVAALADKIVQRAVVEVLNAIEEADFLGFSYGFSTGTRPARCVGRAGGWDRTQAGGLGVRRGFPRLLHQPRSFVAGDVSRAPDRGYASPAPDPEMAQGRGGRGRGVVGERGGIAARGDCFAVARKRRPALRLRSVGPAVAPEACPR